METQAGEKVEWPRTGACNNPQDLGASWLNFCLQETLLPGKPWHKVLERLEAALASEVKPQLKDSTRRQIVFRFLGRSFVKRYFGSCPGGSDLPEKNAQDCESYFQVSRLPLARNPIQPSPVCKRPKSIESKDIRLALWKTPVSQVNAEDGRIRPVTDPSVLSCPESDLLGGLLCAIIARRSENLSTVCQRLRGKLLPKQLREFIWIIKLLGAGSRSPMGKTLASSEREARASFGRTVARRTAELKLRTATRSPVSGLIENAVVEKYSKTPCLSHFATNEQMIIESSKTLNVLYVFNGIYEPYLIHWLFPLQMAFQEITPTDEHPYELAMYLWSLSQNLFPKWAEIYAVADSVMSFLEREDAAFFSHLWSSFKRNITIDPKDFLVNPTLPEEASAQQILPFEKRGQPTPNRAKEWLANPGFFLRKWMGEGFVGVLNFPAVLLVWDQLFMQDWDANVMQTFCTSILLLLKDSFMAADDYPAVREVFLLYPSRLLTADIQKAWIHLQQGGLPADIPGHNSLRDGAAGLLRDSQRL